MMSLIEFTVLIFVLTKMNRGSVTSWLRTPEHNKKVGGVENSRHIHGLAVDIVFETETDKLKFMSEAEHASLFVLDEKTHVHVGVPREKERA